MLATLSSGVCCSSSKILAIAGSPRKREKDKKERKDFVKHWIKDSGDFGSYESVYFMRDKYCPGVREKKNKHRVCSVGILMKVMRKGL